MAKRTIANLNIKLGANTATLRRDFQGAKGTVRGFADDVAGIAVKVAGALAGMFAIGKAKAAIGEQMQVIDRLGKLSDMVGVSVKDLQAYRLGAELTGTSVESLDKGLQRFVRNLGEARQGYGESIRVFEQLNLDPARLGAMGTADAFRTAVEAIRQIPDPAGRAAAAYGVFGRTGQELLKFIEAGAEGIDSFNRQIDDLGAGLTRLDAAKVEEANDAITRLKMAGSAMTQQLTVALAPAITAATGAITQLTVWLGNLDAGTVANTAKVVGFTVAFIGVVKLIPKIVAGIRLIITALKALATAQAITSALSGPAGWAKLVIGGVAAAGAVAAVSTAFDKATDSANQAAAAADASGNATKQSYEAAAEAIGETTDGLDEAKKKAEELARQGEQLTQSLRTPAEEYRDAIAKARELFSAGAISGETFRRAAAKAREDFEQAFQSAQGIASVTKEQGAAALQRGTREAFSAIQAGMREQRHQVALARQRNQQLATMNATLAAINTNTRDQIRVVSHRI